METIAFFFPTIFTDMLDYLIIGYGLSGFYLSWQLKQKQKDFVVIYDFSKGASRNGDGICNPAILKRYTMSWNGINFLKFATKRYNSIQTQLDAHFFDILLIHRQFHKATEQNDWIFTSQREGLSAFLNPEIQNCSDNSIINKVGYGVVKQLGKLNINALLNNFQSRYTDQFHLEVFDYGVLKISKDKIAYKGFEAKKIIFCEGYGLKANPWFNCLPLIGSKEEYLIIKALKLSKKQIIKGPVFISPMKDNFFWVGASFSRQDKSNKPTEKGRSRLTEKLNRILNTPYEGVNHEAAVRPTVIDRRPLLGDHPLHSNLNILNGLGTRGVLMAPLLSHWLFEFIEKREQIPNEAAINRFESYFNNLKTKHV